MPFTYAFGKIHVKDMKSPLRIDFEKDKLKIKAIYTFDDETFTKDV